MAKIIITKINMELILTFLLSIILTYVIKEYSIKKSLVDIPNERSSHSIPTPHGGGIAIAISWFILLVYLYNTNNINNNLFFALLAGSIISIISYIDDLYDLSAKFRLTIQLIVSILGLIALGGLEKLDFGIIVIENQFITNSFAILMIIWFINLYNFLDGIDGYAGSEMIFLSIVGYLIFSDIHFLVLATSVAGFLIFNWHKAKIFMGDVGSTLLGYNIAIFALYYQNSGTSILVWITLFGLFWFDATLTLYRRYKNKEKLSQAHRKHTYQRAVQAGYRHDRVVLFSIGINIVLFCFVYFIMNILVAFILSVVFLYSVVRFVDTKKGFE
jgi:Fuc2NAc and GlcNAc transferase